MSSYGEPKPERQDVPHTTYRMGYAEGYRAGRIAALREVGCNCKHMSAFAGVECDRCRLLAEAESGKDTVQVGDDR